MQQPVAILDLYLGKNRSGKSHEHESEKSAFTNSSDLKGLRLFEKFRFRDGIVRAAGLTEETKLRVQFSLSYCRRCLRKQRRKPIHCAIATIVKNENGGTGSQTD